MLHDLESLETTLNSLTNELSASLDYLHTLEYYQQQQQQQQQQKEIAKTTLPNNGKVTSLVSPNTPKNNKGSINTLYLEYDKMFEQLFNGESSILHEKTESVIRETFPLDSVNNINNDQSNSEDLISMNETCLKVIVINILQNALSLLVVLNPDKYEKVRFISELELESSTRGTRKRFVDITLLKPGFIVLVELKYISLGYVPYVGYNKLSKVRIVDLKRDSDMVKYRKILHLDKETLYKAIYTDFYNGITIDTSVEEKAFDTISQVRNYALFMHNPNVKAYEYTNDTRKQINLPILPVIRQKDQLTIVQPIPFICFVSHIVNVDRFTV